MQVWSEAESVKGQNLTAEEKWSLGCDLIAKSGDPEAAESLSGAKNNYYRLIRVLEIVLHTGQTLKQLDTKLDMPLDYDFRCGEPQSLSMHSKLIPCSPKKIIPVPCIRKTYDLVPLTLYPCSIVRHAW